MDFGSTFIWHYLEVFTHLIPFLLLYSEIYFVCLLKELAYFIMYIYSNGMHLWIIEWPIVYFQITPFDVSRVYQSVFVLSNNDENATFVKSNENIKMYNIFVMVHIQILLVIFNTISTSPVSTLKCAYLKGKKNIFSYQITHFYFFLVLNAIWSRLN